MYHHIISYLTVFNSHIISYLTVLSYNSLFDRTTYYSEWKGPQYSHQWSILKDKFRNQATVAEKLNNVFVDFLLWHTQIKCIKIKVLLKYFFFCRISAGADGGPLSRVCAYLTLSSALIDTRRNFSAHVSAKSPLNISPNP